MTLRALWLVTMSAWLTWLLTITDDPGPFGQLVRWLLGG